MMNILRVLAVFFNICRLRQGPQDLPDSQSLLRLSLFLYTASSVALSLLEASFKQAVLSSLLDVTLLAIIIASLLYLTKRPARLTQTLTAFAGTGFFFGIVMNPLFYWIKQAKIQNANLDFPILLFLIVVIWSLAVYAHILRNALEINFPMAIIVAIIASFLATSVITAVFPPPSF
jgi:hypothetical protein